MTEGEGYWIELTNSATLLIAGSEPVFPYNIDLVTTVWHYNAATGIWTYFTTIQGAPQGSLIEMTEGEGYWIEMTAPNTLVINVG